jgi:hypothetical protein
MKKVVMASSIVEETLTLSPYCVIVRVKYFISTSDVSCRWEHYNILGARPAWLWFVKVLLGLGPLDALPA